MGTTLSLSARGDLIKNVHSHRVSLKSLNVATIPFEALACSFLHCSVQMRETVGEVDSSERNPAAELRRQRKCVVPILYAWAESSFANVREHTAQLWLGLQRLSSVNKTLSPECFWNAMTACSHCAVYSGRSRRALPHRLSYWPVECLLQQSHRFPVRQLHF